MTSFVNSTQSFEHSGIVRMHRGALLLQSMADTVRAGYRAWVSSRKQAVEDERTWNAALKDARIMAELSRAMQGQGR